MDGVRETTTVAIVGAGPGGLTLANLLRSAGIACVVLERQSRSYVEQRQRAGVLEHCAARIFEEWAWPTGCSRTPRGPHSSRYYLQCPPDDDLEKWSDERVWEQLRMRLGDDALPAGPITAKAVDEMRSFVVDPMSYGRLFLVGDAAHIITPMGGKGMNLALADAEVLARGLSAGNWRGRDWTGSSRPPRRRPASRN